MEESFDKPSFLIYKHDFNSISYFSDELLGFYYLEQSVNIKMIKRRILMRILELSKLFSSSRRSLSMMIKII